MIVFIKNAEAEHGLRAAFSSSFLEPLTRRGIILRHAVTLHVKLAEAEHGLRIVLSSGLLKPLARRGVVLWHAQTVVISNTKIAHRSCVAMFGASLEQRERLVFGFAIHLILYVPNDVRGACQYRICLLSLLLGCHSLLKS